MTLNAGVTEPRDFFQDVDWSKTRAYAIGLGGLFLNVRGREGQGCVDSGDVGSLKKELKTGLAEVIKYGIIEDADFFKYGSSPGIDNNNSQDLFSGSLSDSSESVTCTRTILSLRFSSRSTFLRVNFSR